MRLGDIQKGMRKVVSRERPRVLRSTSNGTSFHGRWQRSAFFAPLGPSALGGAEELSRPRSDELARSDAPKGSLDSSEHRHTIGPPRGAALPSSVKRGLSLRLKRNNAEVREYLVARYIHAGEDEDFFVQYDTEELRALPQTTPVETAETTE